MSVDVCTEKLRCVKLQDYKRAHIYLSLCLPQPEGIDTRSTNKYVRVVRPTKVCYSRARLDLSYFRLPCHLLQGGKGGQGDGMFFATHIVRCQFSLIEN